MVQRRVASVGWDVAEASLGLIYSHFHNLLLSHILTISYCHIVYCIGGRGLREGGLPSPPRDPSKLCFKLLILTYLWDSYHMVVYTHKCLFEAIWTGAILRYLELSEAIWSSLELTFGIHFRTVFHHFGIICWAPFSYRFCIDFRMDCGFIFHAVLIPFLFAHATC